MLEEERRAFTEAHGLQIAETIKDVTEGSVLQALAKLPVSKWADDAFECALCMEWVETGMRVRALQCGHFQFHATCIDRWLVDAQMGTQRRCPLCNADPLKRRQQQRGDPRRPPACRNQKDEEGKMQPTQDDARPSGTAPWDQLELPSQAPDPLFSALSVAMACSEPADSHVPRSATEVLNPVMAAYDRRRAAAESAAAAGSHADLALVC